MCTRYTILLLLLLTFILLQHHIHFYNYYYYIWRYYFPLNILSHYFHNNNLMSHHAISFPADQGHFNFYLQRQPLNLPVFLFCIYRQISTDKAHNAQKCSSFFSFLYSLAGSQLPVFATLTSDLRLPVFATGKIANTANYLPA